ncbi:GDP-mannose 4,6-dehydratase [Conexibacter sp. DBS9H8]|uniref:GDP-mannose 4,6-dehydratase n=1 Tax=Conexibacter sp. DBS9H8 TaxID=2937801 RepID=UPI00200E77EB|nr:GDP-mannose 4,6-dehydratase [Conexibacter sp. DBS9H8]
MRVLITGASGFVGGWLARTCVEAGDEVIGISRSGTVTAGQGRAVDLRDAAAVAALLADTDPEAIYHLGALSHVGRSWEQPAETLAANVGGAVALLEAVRRVTPRARVLWASTCEVYGSAPDLPVTEAAPLAPVNPYAVSKAAADMLAGVYAAAHGLDVVRARPFNHVGPGQRPIFLVASLAEQAARALDERADALTILTGNPDTRRDYTDVRDVCAAYRALVHSAPTGVYNVCSGVSVSARELVRLVGELIAPVAVHHEIDPARVRAHEVIDHRGSAAALTAATGWTPQIPLARTVADTIAAFRAQRSGVRAGGFPG